METCVLGVNKWQQVTELDKALFTNKAKSYRKTKKSWNGNFKNVKLCTTRGHEIATLRYLCKSSPEMLLGYSKPVSFILITSLFFNTQIHGSLSRLSAYKQASNLTFSHQNNQLISEQYKVCYSPQ